MSTEAVTRGDNVMTLVTPHIKGEVIDVYDGKYVRVAVILPFESNSAVRVAVASCLKISERRI